MTGRFNRYGSYLKRKYGEPVYRIGVDMGFGCPNRSPRGGGGCFYCDETGALAPYQSGESHPFTLRSSSGPDVLDVRWKRLVEEQVRAGERFLKRRYGARVFILYQQAFSGTYAPAGRLEAVYDFALSLAPFRELVVGTRPDCFDEEKGKLFAGYRDRVEDVWIEFGLQSFHDDTLARIGRGHSAADFERAFRTAREHGLKCAVHLIFGLPGEDDTKILESVRRLSDLRPDGVKIHNLHIAEGTRFAELWRRGELEAPDTAAHLRRVVAALELLPETTVIQRLTCDTVPGRLLAPLDFASKNEFYDLVEKRLEETDGRQGRLYGRKGRD